MLAASEPPSRSVCCCDPDLQRSDRGRSGQRHCCRAAAEADHRPGAAIRPSCDGRSAPCPD
eukprot:4162891-Prymnesium_polylepis.1